MVKKTDFKKCGRIIKVSLGIGDKIQIRSGKHKGKDARIYGWVLDRITGVGPRGKPSIGGIVGAKVKKTIVRIDRWDRVKLPNNTKICVYKYRY